MQVLNSTVKKGDNVSLQCAAQGYPLHIEWKFQKDDEDFVQRCISKINFLQLCNTKSKVCWAGNKIIYFNYHSHPANSGIPLLFSPFPSPAPLLGLIPIQTFVTWASWFFFPVCTPFAIPFEICHRRLATWELIPGQLLTTCASRAKTIWELVKPSDEIVILSPARRTGYHSGPLECAKRLQ